MPKEGNLEVINRYGQVIVETWDLDSIALEIKITAYGKSDEAVDKVLIELNLTSSKLVATSLLKQYSIETQAPSRS